MIKRVCSYCTMKFCFCDSCIKDFVRISILSHLSEAENECLDVLLYVIQEIYN